MSSAHHWFMPEVPEVFTEYEVAELLRVQVAVVRRLRKQGRPPPFVMVGNHARYPRSAIFAFLTAVESTPRQEAGKET
jgi:excisionase family DNA binding protein